MDVCHEKKRKSKWVEAKIRRAGSPSKRPAPTDCPTAFVSVDEDPTATTGTDTQVLSQESGSTSTSTSYSTDDIDELDYNSDSFTRHAH